MRRAVLQVEIGAARRIHILGGAGSGKSTLALRLASALGVPAYDLDIAGYENGAGAKRPPDARRADVQAILAQPGWVAEGIFLWWTDDLLAGADLIIWLNVPWRVAAWRIVLRHLKAELRRSNKHPGWRKLLRFLRRTHEWYRMVPRAPHDACDDGATCRAATALECRRYRDKLVVVNGPARFTLGGRVIPTRGRARSFARFGKGAAVAPAWSARRVRQRMAKALDIARRVRRE